MMRETIRWLETTVRDLGFNPQDLELRTWQRLHRDVGDRDRVELSSEIRRALTESRKQQWP
jgi:hypothetical protein